MCFWRLLIFSFFANERYKHINLLNIFISATLFVFESTLQCFVFSKSADYSQGATVLRKPRGGGGDGEGGCRSSLDPLIVFVWLWREREPHSGFPVGPCVLILSISRGGPSSFSVKRSGLSHPSTHPPIGKQESQWRCEEFTSRWHLHLFEALTEREKTNSSFSTSVLPFPLLIYSAGTKRGLSSFVGDDKGNQRSCGIY